MASNKGSRVNYSIEELKCAIDKSFCFSDVCRKLNITICSFNFDRIRKLSLENSIDYSHFDIKKTFQRGKFQWTKEDFLLGKKSN